MCIRDSLLRLHENGLGDIRALGRAGREHFIPQRGEHFSRESGALQGCAGNAGSKVNALEKRAVSCQIGADLHSHALAGEAAANPLDGFFCSGDIAAGRGDARTRVFDQRADDDIRAGLRRLHGFRELAIAVIHHDKDIRICLFDCPGCLTDLRDGQRRAQLIAPGALQIDDFNGGIQI